MCCETTLCVIGAKVFKKQNGPCPALLRGLDDLSSCGVLKFPGAYAPTRVARHGAAAVKKSASILLGSGVGCDATRDGEIVFESTRNAMIDRAFQRFTQAELTKARKVWGL